jgi:hypothetical protein
MIREQVRTRSFASLRAAFRRACPNERSVHVGVIDLEKEGSRDGLKFVRDGTRDTIRDTICNSDGLSRSDNPSELEG